MMCAARIERAYFTSCPRKSKEDNYRIGCPMELQIDEGNVVCRQVFAQKLSTNSRESGCPVCCQQFQAAAHFLLVADMQCFEQFVGGRGRGARGIDDRDSRIENRRKCLPNSGK